jgi:hypothetical protein
MIQNRRHFIKKSLAGMAIPYLLPVSVFGKPETVAPSDRIVMGFIGVGNMGSGHLRSFLGYPDVHVAAVCDVRESHRLRAKELVDQSYENRDCAVYHDFRELLARPDIDAVLIAVPDHWHVLIGLEAARNGKHMYYEKPLSRSIRESKAIRDQVRKSGVVFQFGTQQRSDQRFRLACELVRNGKIGELQTIMIGSANYKQIPAQPVQTVPEGFDYDFWLGPAAWAPYTFERCTRNWTLLYDYSLGCVSGAWGIHHVDIAQWANDADATFPIEIEGTGTFPEQGFYDTAIAWEVEHKYANGVKLVHMDMPSALKRAPQFKLFWMGMLFLGSEGWIYVAREFMDAEPKSLLKTVLGGNEKHLPQSVDHRRNFLDAIKNRKTTISPIQSAYHSDVVCHHDDLAMRLGRKLTWDVEKEEFVNDPEANSMMARSMRSPWHL